MAVKIIIRRRLKEGNLNKASEMLILARTNAMEEQGYISSETLRGCEDPNEIVVISMWEKKEDWDRYQEKASRREIEVEFEKLLDGPAVYDGYNLGLYA